GQHPAARCRQGQRHAAAAGAGRRRVQPPAQDGDADFQHRQAGDRRHRRGPGRRCERCRRRAHRRSRGPAAALIVDPVTRPELRECFGCGMFQIVPALGPDQRADCVRCGTALRRTRRDPFNRCLALTVASLVLFVVLWTGMLMMVSTAGIVHETTLASGPLELVRHGLWPLALSVAFTTAIAPFGKYAGMLYVLLGLRARTPYPYLGRAFRFARQM